MMGNIVVFSLVILYFKAMIRFSSGGCLGCALGKSEDVDLHRDYVFAFGSWLEFDTMLGFMLFVFSMISGCGSRSS
jgi:hypothetical protein